MRTGNSKSKRFSLLALIAAILFSLPVAQAQNSDPVVIYTDTFRPFIQGETEPDGDGMRMVRLILENMDQPYEIRFRDFGFSLYTAERTAGTATFPWRKVPEREAKFHFSEALFDAQTRLYYNRQSFPEGLRAEALQGITIGRLEDYAYTGVIAELLDDAGTENNQVQLFAREANAIRALLLGEVDVLPLPATVVEATTRSNFPNHIELLQTVDGIAEPFPLHMIAAKTPEGEAFISAFDESFRELLDAGIIEAPMTGEQDVDTNFGVTAELLASEGFPVIVGRRASDGENEFFAIPQGTRALVLDWSDTILSASKSDRIFKTMVDETRVLILNGPHVGKELFVKNMHISVL